MGLQCARTIQTPSTIVKPARRRHAQFLPTITRAMRHFNSRLTLASTKNLHPLSAALLGILLTLILTALSSYVAYRRSRAFYVVNDAPTLAETLQRSVSPFTAARVSNSLNAQRNVPVVQHVLKHSFNIPVSLTRKINLHDQYHLLTRLQSYKAQYQLPPRLFVLHVVGDDPVARLSAIASAVTYSHHTSRFLLIMWDVARGGESFGCEPLTPLVGADKQSFMFTTVDSLSLSPNASDWSEFQINYYTQSSGGYPLDNVAALQARHIFYRNDSTVAARYASLYPGVMTMHSYLVPSTSIQRAWYTFVKDWTFPHLGNEEVADILHRVYSIPWLFSEALSVDMKRRLLRALNQSSAKRALFVHAQYGLGNRLRALGSAMAVAKVTGRVLVLIWEPDIHLNCVFSDLFANDLITIEKFNFEWPKEKSRVQDEALRSVDFYNFMLTEGVQIHNPIRHTVNPKSGRHVYIKTAYVVRSSFTPRIISTTSAYWNTMREQLLPTAEIMHLVHDPSFINIREMVGVHIRSRTIENDIKGVNEQFYGNGSRTTDHWRRITGLKTFETKIARLSRRYRFFVAADTRSVIQRLERRFGTHRIFSIQREKDCVTRDVECAKLALADIMLLSKVPTLLGSNWSSFTEGAVRLSGHLKVLLAGVHFGRQPKQGGST